MDCIGDSFKCVCRTRMAKVRISNDSIKEKENIPAPVRNHIERNPLLTAVQLVLIILALAPGSIAAPVLGALGFSSVGPVAGKRVPITSNSLYSTLT